MDPNDDQGQNGQNPADPMGGGQDTQVPSDGGQGQPQAPGGDMPSPGTDTPVEPGAEVPPPPPAAGEPEEPVAGGDPTAA